MTSAADIAATLERLSRVVLQEAHAMGMNPVQWEALRYLARANRFSRTPGALTAYLGATKGTVSQTLRTLAARGWIEKTPDRGDRRSVRLALTDAGRDRLNADPQALIDAAASALDPKAQADTARALQDILRLMIAERGRRPFGACRDCRFFERRHPGGAPHRCGLIGAPLSSEDSAKICAEQQPAEAAGA